MESSGPAIEDTSRRFLAQVFVYMFAGLAISSACLYAFNTYRWCIQLIFTNDSFTTVAWFSLIAPFAISYIVRKGINVISFVGLWILFILYAALIGICFAFILLDFIDSSLFGIFIAACLVFGIAGIVGYTTKIDLTQFKPILYLMLAGLIIVTPVVFLLPDLQMNLWVSYLGVIVFFGIAALHFQDIKETGAQPGLEPVTTRKLALLGSLSLYADFVNLFLFLLGLFFKKK